MSEQMREALAAIEFYGSDTLSGRVDDPADAEWYREAVVEMTKLATTTLAASPAEKQEPVAWADPNEMREYFASSMKPAATIYYQRYGRYTKPLYDAAPVDETGQGELSGNQYRKRPIVITAIRYRAGEQDGEFSADVSTGRVRYPEDGTMLIQTLEGVMCAQPGDWIIRGVKGELYPCKPDIFAATYESALPHPTDGKDGQK